MNKSIRLSVLAALMVALTFLFTAYVMHIPVGVGSGYIHLGDTMVYLGAALLPTPYAVAAAALGGALSDALSGGFVWVIPTVLIKALMVLPFTAKEPKLLCRRNLLAPLVAGLTGVVGYAIAEVVILCLSGSALSAAVTGSMVSVLPNVMQEVAGGVAFIFLALALDRAEAKKRLLRMS